MQDKSRLLCLIGCLVACLSTSWLTGWLIEYLACWLSGSCGAGWLISSYLRAPLSLQLTLDQLFTGSARSFRVDLFAMAAEEAAKAVVVKVLPRVAQWQRRILGADGSRRDAREAGRRERDRERAARSPAHGSTASGQVVTSVATVRFSEVR